MEIKTIKSTWGKGQLDQNTHVIIGDKTCVVIDAGAPLSEIKKLTSLPIEAVFITHGHFDHVEYIEEYDKLGVPIYASEKLSKFLEDSQLNVSSNKTYKVKNIVPMHDGEKIECLLGFVKCFETPGHSEDSMCYILNDGALFSGDTVFSIAVGRTDLPTGDVEELISSIERILNLKFGSVYAGHGRISTKEEQKTNISKWINYLRNVKTM